jgi:hypothetical protein
VRDDVARLRQNYGVAFLRYLGRRDEPALLSAYELGRGGLTSGVSLLDVVQIHHAVLVEALRGASSSDVPDIAEAAAAFLAEVLASFDMTRRAVLERAAAEHPADPHDPS